MAVTKTSSSARWLRTVPLALGVALASAAMAQDSAPAAPNSAANLKLPNNPELFGTKMPSVVKAKVLVNNEVITQTDVDQRLALLAIANGGEIPANEVEQLRQQVLATLGRLDQLAASGGLAALLASGARFCEQAILLAALDNPEHEPRLQTRRIGAPLVFGRLWQETGCRAVIDELLAGRAFAFPVERAIFTVVLHRIMVSGSDRACGQGIAAAVLARIGGAMTGAEDDRAWRAAIGEAIRKAEKGR